LARAWRHLVGAGRRSNTPDAGLILTRRASLRLASQRLEQGDPDTVAATRAIVEDADRCLKRPIKPITDKKRLPPSGDARDFFSIGTYWWPNPDTEDGLPYVRRDGRVNPEAMKSDTGKVRRLCRESRILSLAWMLTGQARYAEHCAALLRTWFVDPAHAMNPHLSYAQSIPGVSDGRSYGIIDTRGFRYLVDSATLILDQGSWTAAEHDRLGEWMGQFLDWLLSSQAGRKENASKNNHGTWYSAQVLSLALFCGRKKLASKLALAARNRIEEQIEANGSQPAEFQRSRPLTYCTMNLWAFFEVATAAERTDVDLWSYRAPGGGSLQQAALWLLPYVRRDQDWPEREIIDYKPEHYLSLFRRAALHYDAAFEPKQLPLDQKKVSRDQVHILYPV
jgi:hypothetical protein